METLSGRSGWARRLAWSSDLERAAAFALILAATAALPEPARMAVVSILLTTAFCVLAIEALIGIPAGPVPRDRCHRCRRGTIGRVSAGAAGLRRYRCDLCGARYWRKSLAEDFEDDDPDGASCGEAAVPPPAEVAGATRTLDALLGAQRIRKVSPRVRDSRAIALTLAPPAAKEGPRPARDVGDLRMWDRELDG
jgi:hypothetical protein